MVNQQTVRPRRSVLYMPGANERALEKAKGIPADSLILDLEDSVAPDLKVEARKRVCTAIQKGGYGSRELVIRINGLDTPWGEADFESAIKVEPDAILVPKVSSPNDVRNLNQIFKSSGAESKIALWVMLETPKAILSVLQIAEVSMDRENRLANFIMGTNDLAKDMQLIQTEDRTPLLTSLSLCILAARAFGIGITDGVYNDLKNLEGFSSSVRQSRELGFDGKTLIHPGQVGPCNEEFSPLPEEVRAAEEIVSAFELPENKNKGVITVNGKMVELLHAEIARRTVSIAESIAAMKLNSK